MNIEFLHPGLTCLQVFNIIGLIFGCSMLASFLAIVGIEAVEHYKNRKRRVKWLRYGKV